MRRYLLAAGLLFFILTLRQAAISGISNNTLLLFALSAGFGGYGWFYQRLRTLKWLNWIIRLSIIFVGSLVVLITAYGLSDNTTYDEDAVLVLGCGIRGEDLSLTLQKRLETAYNYYQRNPGVRVVVSGGQGPRESIPEAVAMQRYLISRGIPEDQIICEDRSLSTYENMVYSKQILDTYFKGEYRIAVVTSDFHTYRAERFARIAGMVSTRCHARTPWYTQPVNYVRECAAIIKLWVIKR